MSSYMEGEIRLFLWAVCAGSGLFSGYVLLRMLRLKLLSHWAVADFFEILYWLGAGILIFTNVYVRNQGILRLFLFLGFGLGAFLTRLFLIPIIKKIVEKPINILLFLWKSCKILGNQFVNQYKNGTEKHLQTKRGRKFGQIRKK